jgi:hypothetical protein
MSGGRLKCARFPLRVLVHVLTRRVS